MSFDGTDLDTRTAILGTGSEYDGQTVGWAEQNTVGTGPNYYLQWGGDNTTPSGYESVLVNMKQLAIDFPLISTFELRLRTYWYRTRLDGNLTIQIQTFNGGTMVPFTTATGQTDWNNSGGTLSQLVTIPRNSPTGPTLMSVPGDEQGIITYTVAPRTATYTPPTFRRLTESGDIRETEDGLNERITEDGY